MTARALRWQNRLKALGVCPHCPPPTCTASPTAESRIEMDLTIEGEVVKLMQSSKSEKEWNSNADKVKEANGGDYPRFWYQAVILSGVHTLTASKW